MVNVGKQFTHRTTLHRKFPIPRVVPRARPRCTINTSHKHASAALTGTNVKQPNLIAEYKIQFRNGLILSRDSKEEYEEEGKETEKKNKEKKERKLVTYQPLRYAE